MGIIRLKKGRTLASCLVAVILSGFGSLALSSQKTRTYPSESPPVGQRVYQVRSQGAARFLPVKVRKDPGISSHGFGSESKDETVGSGRQGVLVFRDPTLSQIVSSDPTLKYPEVAEDPKERRVVVRSKSVYHLRALKIKGAWHKPRVPFHEIKMKTKRVIEPISGHFIDKIGKNLPDLSTSPPE